LRTIGTVLIILGLQIFVTYLWDFFRQNNSVLFQEIITREKGLSGLSGDEKIRARILNSCRKVLMTG